VQLSHDGTPRDSEICSYDAGGKKTKVRHLDPRAAIAIYSIEGSEQSYGAPGATMITTTYDERELPTKVVFQDANHNSLRYVILMPDCAGRLLKEEMHVGVESPFPDLLDRLPPEEREGMAAMLKTIFGEAFSSTTCVYDSQGRLLERTNRMGSLSVDRTTYHYTDHDDPCEATIEDRGREAGIDKNGALRYSADRVSLQHSRFEYRYDAHGNWTERTVSGRPESNPVFQRSNIERRVITYHAG